MEMDYRCRQDRVMDTDEWMAAHKPHGEAEKRLNENQPPKGTYQIYTLICPCGAKHIISETQVATTCLECGAKGFVPGPEGMVHKTILCDRCQRANFRD